MSICLDNLQTHHPDTRKPAFRWLGIKGKSEICADPMALHVSKKRAFGTELTNTMIKRSKVITKLDGDLGQASKAQFQPQIKCEPMEDEVPRSKFQVDAKTGVKSYQFGPFAPVNVSTLGVSEDNKAKSSHNWESLATTYRPQYHNQGTELHTSLFRYLMSRHFETLL